MLQGISLIFPWILLRLVVGILTRKALTTRHNDEAVDYFDNNFNAVTSGRDMRVTLKFVLVCLYIQKLSVSNT